MDYKKELLNKINSKSAKIGIIGLGYVGLPLALTFAEKGFDVLGFDIDEKKIPIINSGGTYIKHIPSARIKENVESKKFAATSDFSKLTGCDAVIICVPTPLDEHREPDISFVENSAKVAADNMRPGQLIVLESSTYPGTTDELLLPLFENSKIRPAGTEKFIVGKDFFLAFSPEREDPNNPNYNTETIPKIVGGVTKDCLDVAVSLYSYAVVQVVPVANSRVAEAAKLLENIYRSVNIALVNELKMAFDKMNIDIWEVIAAAKTKPFGFQAFYPGPGLGGHCIPIDPFYLSWKAKEYDVNTKFIELAGEINTLQPYYVVTNSIEALNQKGKSIKGARVLILGVSYKKNIDDTRESPSLKLIELFESKGAVVDYSDPFIPAMPPTRKYKYDKKSVECTAANLALYDLVMLSTDHDAFEYEFIAKNSDLIIDTRNAFGNRGIAAENIVKS